MAINNNNNWYYSILRQNDKIFYTKTFLKTFSTWPDQIKALQACIIPPKKYFRYKDHPYIKGHNSDEKFITTIKGYNAVLICQNLTICNPRTLLHNIDSHTNLKKIGKGMPKIESEKLFLTSIKGRNSVLICQNLSV